MRKQHIKDFLPKNLLIHSSLIEKIIDFILLENDKIYCRCPDCKQQQCQIYNFFSDDVWCYCENCGFKDFLTIILQREFLIPDILSSSAVFYKNNILPLKKQLEQYSQKYYSEIKQRLSSKLYQKILPESFVYLENNTKDKGLEKSLSIFLYLLPGLPAAIYKIIIQRPPILLWPKLSNCCLFSDFLKIRREEKVRLTNSFHSFLFQTDYNTVFVCPAKPGLITSTDPLCSFNLKMYYPFDYSDVVLFDEKDFIKLLINIQENKQIISEKIKNIWLLLNKTEKRVFKQFIETTITEEEDLQDNKKYIDFASENYLICKESIINLEKQEKICNFNCECEKICLIGNKTFYLLNFYFNNTIMKLCFSERSIFRHGLIKLLRNSVLTHEKTIKELPFVIRPKYEKIILQLAIKQRQNVEVIKFKQNLLRKNDWSFIFSNGILLNGQFWYSPTKIHDIVEYDLSFEDTLKRFVDKNQNISETEMEYLKEIIQFCKCFVQRLLFVPKKPLVIVYSNNKFISCPPFKQQKFMKKLKIVWEKNKEMFDVLSKSDKHELLLLNPAIFFKKYKKIINVLITKFFIEWYKFSEQKTNLSYIDVVKFWNELLMFLTKKSISRSNFCYNIFYRPIFEWKS